MEDTGFGFVKLVTSEWFVTPLLMALTGGFTYWLPKFLDRKKAKVEVDGAKIDNQSKKTDIESKYYDYSNKLMDDMGLKLDKFKLEMTQMENEYKSARIESAEIQLNQFKEINALRVSNEELSASNAELRRRLDKQEEAIERIQKQYVEAKKVNTDLTEKLAELDTKLACQALKLCVREECKKRLKIEDGNTDKPKTKKP